MAESTLSAARASIWTTVLTAVGVVFLGFTLWYTHETLVATRSAVDETRRLGEAQVRAYLSVEKAEIVCRDRLPPIIRLSVKNSGNSPARNVKILHKIAINKFETDLTENNRNETWKTFPDASLIASGAVNHIQFSDTFHLPLLRQDRKMPAGMTIAIHGAVAYKTVFSTDHEDDQHCDVTFRFVGHIDRDSVLSAFRQNNEAIFTMQSFNFQVSADTSYMQEIINSRRNAVLRASQKEN